MYIYIALEVKKIEKLEIPCLARSVKECGSSILLHLKIP